MKNGYLLIILTIIISNYFCKYLYTKKEVQKFIFLKTLALTLGVIYLLNMLLLIFQQGIESLNFNFRSLSNLLAETLGYILPIVTIVYFVIRYKKIK
jgi:hypothetical protein